MDNDFATMTLDDCPAPTQAPEGYYRAVIGNYKAKTAGKSGGKVVEFNMTLVSAISDVDLSGIDLRNTQTRTALWFFDDQSRHESAKRIREVYPDVDPAARLDDIFDSLIGREVSGYLKYSKRGDRLEAKFYWTSDEKAQQKNAVAA